MFVRHAHVPAEEEAPEKQKALSLVGKETFNPSTTIVVPALGRQ
jgi:hypothetical protein